MYYFVVIGSVLMAKLRVESFNFYKYDYYEPLHFCLTPESGYSSFEFQLKILFQFVKPSSQFSLVKTVDTSRMKPIAYHIEILSSSLNVHMWFVCNVGNSGGQAALFFV